MPLICIKTYQERRRDGPYDVLATLESRVPNPTPNMEVDDETSTYFLKSFLLSLVKTKNEQDHK